jgi:hypothetical protein
MAHLDGNVLAGPLSEIFVSDMTMAEGCCANCGDVAVFAMAMVDVEHESFAVRCHNCDNLIATLVQTATENRLDLSGLRWLRVPRAE